MDFTGIKCAYNPLGISDVKLGGKPSICPDGSCKVYPELKKLSNVPKLIK